ncbi:MAG: hypothetical protein VX278_02970 [Myxococcota bacterium]|nr:hypothetical protein [Myxococcota bacterium]
MKIHLLTGPPFGKKLWEDCAKRLSQLGYQIEIISLFERTGSLEEELKFMHENIQSEDVCLSHGLANPVLMQFSSQSPAQLIAFSNGPIDSLDIVTRSFVRLPSFLQKIYLHPKIAHRYLHSSLGLRRLVVNPYVMERDTVVALCSGLQDATTRSHYIKGIKHIMNLEKGFQSQAANHLAIWGDEDLLYPSKVASKLQNKIPNLKRIDIPGGKFLHPIERPWAIADVLHNEIQKL